jgi:hypothetical protein
MTNLMLDQPNRIDIARKLQGIVDYHLFASTSWPADIESVIAFWRTLEQLGLEERVLGGNDTIQFTALGVDCGAPLVSCLIGAHNLMEIPFLLERLGLIEMEDAAEAYSFTGDDEFVRQVEALVRRAHFRVYGQSSSH